MDLFDRAASWWYVWLPVLLYILFRDDLGSTAMYVSTQYLIFYFLTLTAGWAINEQGKYNSPMLVVNDEHICVKHPVPAGKWAVFTDYIDAPAYFLTYPLNKKTIVVPRSSVYSLGKNYFSPTRVVRTRYESLPYHAQQVIDSSGYSRDTVFFGTFSESFERGMKQEERKRWGELSEDLDLARDASTKNREAAQYNLKDIEGLKSHYDRIGGARRTLWTRIKDAGRKEDEEK